MRISAKSDYGVRAALALVGASAEQPVSSERIAEEQDIPLPFLSNILDELAHHGLVDGRHGATGGFWLGPAPEDITLAELINAVDGPLASVRGEDPESMAYPAGAEALKPVWIALAANVHAVLDRVTLADLAAGELPGEVAALGEGATG